MPERIYKYTTLKTAILMLSDETIRFTPPRVLNDPFDCRPAIGSNTDLDQAAAMFERAGHLGVVCLTRCRSNELMWAYYAKMHTGVLLEFDATHPFFEGTAVSFVDDNLDALVDGIADVRYVAHRQEYAGTAEELLYKSVSWSHEKEVRMLGSFDRRPRGLPDPHRLQREPYEGPPDYLARFPMESLVGVTFGSRSCFALSNSSDGVHMLSPLPKARKLLQLVEEKAPTCDRGVMWPDMRSYAFRRHQLIRH